MRRILALILALVSFVGFFSVARAATKYSSFGGDIISKPAAQIIALQAIGFNCGTDGAQTFTIKPAPKTKSAGPYFADNLAIKGIPKISDQILGLYLPKAKTITCINFITGQTKIVMANKVWYGGLSKTPKLSI
jgi:hypothetical protein